MLIDRVTLLAEGTEGERDRASAQLDVARLVHDTVCVGDDEIGESAVVFFEPFRTLCVQLTRYLRSKVGELLVELLDLTLGFEMLKSAANGRVGETDGDGLEGAGIELWVSLHDIEGTLWGEGVVVVMDAGDDFAFLRIGARGNGKLWTFDGGADRFGSWCARERNGGWIDESDSGGSEFWLEQLRRDGGLDVVDRAVGFGRGRHVVVVWKCWWR